MATSKASGALKQFVAEIIGDGKLAEEGKEEIAREREAAHRRQLDAKQRCDKKDRAP